MHANDTISIVDTLSIVPGSVRILNRDTTYNERLKQIVNENQLTLRLLNPTSTTTEDSLEISYRVFPYNFGKSFARLDSSNLLPKPGELYIGYDLNIYDQKKASPLFSDGLEYDGSFGRGLSFGNNQNLVYNGNFNLQLGGKISDDTEILAYISDANIPIQAEGTTQQLQDFDKVFIQLKRKNTKLIAGDYEINRPNSYFINYFKKLKGLSVSQNIEDQKFGSWNNKASAAISRGKFARNILEVREGNQGPYKLTGNDGERFLIVLSGTEKVYFDGQLMKRGLENDYVIYYDRAEIVFTTNRLITKDSRIIVEFEYADQKYLRSLYQFESNWKHKKWSLDFSLVSQQDSRNTAGTIELDSTDLFLLQNAGDQSIDAIRSGIVRNTESYSNNRVYYKKVYESSINDSVLVFTSNPDSANYRANFSEVGQGNGSYIIDQTVNANGRVYKYVGQMQGNYEPYIRLVAPEQKQMYALKARYEVSQNSFVNAEIGVSHFDLNRFSTLEDSDNVGLSGRLEWQHNILMGKKKNWSVTPIINLESKASNFRSFNPYRNAEFVRDWNIDNTVIANELLGDYGLLLHNKERSHLLSYTLSTFDQYGNYEGRRHRIQSQLKQNGFDISFQNNYLSSNSNVINTVFSRPKVNISKRFKKLNNWQVGWYGERERNEFRPIGGDTITDNSYRYDYTKYFISSDPKENFSLAMSYNQRVDYSGRPGTLTRSTTANEYQIAGNLKNGSISNATWGFTYRALGIDDESLTEEKARATLLGNFNHVLNLWKGSFRSTVNYKVSSGQEPKIEYDFREVLIGQGDYIWVDDGDGVQERNEFQVAPFKDQANYVRVNLFNNEFIKTNNVGFTQSLRLEPKNWYSQKDTISNFGKVMRRFSVISNFRLDNKNQSDANLLSLSQFDIQDTSLVSYSSLYSGILYFNRGNPNYDLQLGRRNNRNRLVQTAGFEDRGVNEDYFRARVAFNKNIDIISIVTRGSKTLASEIFSNNDYQIAFTKVEPQISYRYGDKLRINTSYLYEEKRNNIKEKESAIINDLSLGITYSKVKTSRINAEIKYAAIKYNGVANTAIELNMLDGLKNGNNILWKLDYTVRIMKNVDVNISYEGRKTGQRNTTHVGRAQVNSRF